MTIEIGLVQKGNKRAEYALKNYNELQNRDPETLARVLAQRALNAPHDPTADAIVERIDAVLDRTNGGEGFTFDPTVEETVWAVIFADDGHKEARIRYHEAMATGDHSAAEAATRLRGHHALKAVAIMNSLQHEPRSKELASTSA